MDQANGYRGGHESHVRPENGSLPNSSLLLGFESLGECSKTRRHWSRDGVILLLQGLPNCCERNVSVATGIYFALRGIGNDVSTYPVVDPISSGGEMRHGPLPASPPPVPRTVSRVPDQEKHPPVGRGLRAHWHHPHGNASGLRDVFFSKEK